LPIVKKKVYISIFFALLISLFSLKSFLVMAYYISFTDTFIENYCVNKDKPALECNGKCELSKLLDRNSTENDNQEKMMLISSSELVFCYEAGNFEISTAYLSENFQPSSHLSQLYAFNFLEKQIKPPIELT